MYAAPAAGWAVPRGGLYVRMAELLAAHCVAGLRLNYRHRGHLQSCVLDVLAGISFLGQEGRTRVVLVGHSFGGGGGDQRGGGQLGGRAPWRR